MRGNGKLDYYILGTQYTREYKNVFNETGREKNITCGCIALNECAEVDTRYNSNYLFISDHWVLILKITPSLYIIH